MLCLRSGVLRSSALIVALTLFSAACAADFDLDAALEPDSNDVPSTDPGDDPDNTPAPDEPSADDDDNGDPPTPDDPPAPDGDAVLVAGNCGFDVPSEAFIDCGTVMVPENYNDPGGTQVELAVAVIRSTAFEPADTPAIYLEGGPGGHAVETIPFVYSDRYVPLLEHSDVIVVDQRGTGLSMPRLTCPEADTTYRALGNEPDLSAEETRERVLQSLGECSSRLTDSGIDLTQYNTENNAHDIDRVRASYGSAQLDLFGISYGTRLGLAVMRLHPDRVRTAVLDSTLPPEVDATADTQGTLVRSYERVVAACAADPACTAEFGDLDARFRSLYDQLEADPLAAVADNFLTGESVDTALDGDALIGLTFGALYDPFAFTDLPELVVDLEAGNVTVAEKYLDLNITNEEFFTLGMFLSFACHDEVSFSSLAAVEAAGIDDPLWAKALATSENVGPFAFDVCEVWGSGVAPAADNEPVTGAIPTLFLAGEFDPVTPPEWASDAAASLDNAQVLTFPTLSHGVTGDVCAMSITASFIADPTAVDISCIDSVPAPAFVAAETTSVELEQYSIDVVDFGVRITSVRPGDWTVDATGVQSSRGASVVDETALVQLGGPTFLAEQLASLVGEQLGIETTETDPVDIGGRSWQHFEGASPAGFTLDVWFASSADFVPIVLLISATAERATLVSLIAEPALETIEVEEL